MLPAFLITMDEDSAADIVLPKQKTYHESVPYRATGENHLPQIPQILSIRVTISMPACQELSR